MIYVTWYGNCCLKISLTALFNCIGYTLHTNI
jgi:hypothetical protein